MTKTELEQAREKADNKALTLITNLDKVIDDNRAKVEESASRGMDVDKLIRIAKNSVQKNPVLLECSPGSVFKSIMECATYGLYPNSFTNEAHLVPFNNKKTGQKECQVIPGYKGLTRMATNTGLVNGVTVRYVYENDQFSYEYGLNEHLVHRPCKTGDPGAFIAAYAILKHKDGSRDFEVVTLEQGRKHRDKFSKAANSYSSPWKTDEPAMIAKTAVRKILKYVPVSAESENLAIAIARDEYRETQGYIDIDPTEPTPLEEIKDPQPKNKGYNIDPDTGDVIPDEVLNGS